MQNNKIFQIIKEGEGLTIEFKSNFNIATIETLVAFANTNGGKVIVGVNDSGKLCGVSLGKESIQQWINEIKSKTEPQILVNTEVVCIDDKQIVIISINEYPVKPVLVQGRSFKRINASNHLMSILEITECFMQSMQYSWDSYLYPNSTYEDMDENKINIFLQKINEKGRISLKGSSIEKLNKLNILKSGQPTNAALLLFAKEPLMYDIHIGRLKTPSLILDDRIIRNTLFEAVNETMKYIISHLKVAIEINTETVLKSTQRVEIFEYPLEAIRELVLNSIIHRAYNSIGDIQIKIFDNKITIFNPGGLYGNLKIEDLSYDDYQSSARNKLIVESFYLTGDIEKYGTGYQRVRNAIKEYPTMSYVCKEIQNGFYVEIFYEKQKKSTYKKDLEKDLGKDLEKDLEKDLKKELEKLNEIQKKILNEINDNPYITQLELSSIIGINSRNIRKNISQLKEFGILSRIGSDKGGKWVLEKMKK